MHKTLRSQLHQLPYNYSQCHVGFSKLTSILKEPVRKKASRGEVPISMQVVCGRKRKAARAPALRRGKEAGAFKWPSLAGGHAGKPRLLENSQLPALGECPVTANSACTLLPLPRLLPPVCCPGSHLYTFEVGGEKLSLLNLDFS